MSKGVAPCFLDTSVFLEVIKLDDRLQKIKLQKLTLTARKEASYFTIIELNRYFLRLAIRLYDTTNELMDVSAANIKVSNEFGRAAKYYSIINSLIMRSTSSVYHTDYRIYTSLIEAFIIAMQEKIHTMVNSFKGDFSGHPLVRSRIYSADDFEYHKDEVDNLEIDFTTIWTKHNKQLRAAEQYFTHLASLKDLTIPEKEIRNFINGLLTDPSKVKSKHIGDMVINLNAPNNAKALAHDKLFTLIGTSLGKNTSYIDFKNV